jgi:hypothetical protein
MQPTIKRMEPRITKGTGLPPVFGIAVTPDRATDGSTPPDAELPLVTGLPEVLPDPLPNASTVEPPVLLELFGALVVLLVVLEVALVVLFAAVDDVPPFAKLVVGAPGGAGGGVPLVTPQVGVVWPA